MKVKCKNYGNCPLADGSGFDEAVDLESYRLEGCKGGHGQRCQVEEAPKKIEPQGWIKYVVAGTAAVAVLGGGAWAVMSGRISLPALGGGGGSLECTPEALEAALTPAAKPEDARSLGEACLAQAAELAERGRDPAAQSKAIADGAAMLSHAAAKGDGRAALALSALYDPQTERRDMPADPILALRYARYAQSANVPEAAAVIVRLTPAVRQLCDAGDSTACFVLDEPAPSVVPALSQSGLPGDPAVDAAVPGDGLAPMPGAPGAPAQPGSGVPGNQQPSDFLSPDELLADPTPAPPATTDPAVP